jgi:hypothetical protein
MTDDLSVCLAYCATSYTENATTKACDLVKTQMFDLSVVSWSQDFKEYIDSQNSIKVQPGANADYESDDPYITNPQDGLKEFYFDGTNDFLLIKEAEVGRSGLLLHHTMTISVWIFCDGAPTD